MIRSFGEWVLGWLTRSFAAYECEGAQGRARAPRSARALKLDWFSHAPMETKTPRSPPPLPVGPLGALLGRSRGSLGVLLGLSGALLGLFSGPSLGHAWVVKKDPRPPLQQDTRKSSVHLAFGVLLGPSRGLLGAVLGPLGAFLEPHLGPSWSFRLVWKSAQK